MTSKLNRFTECQSLIPLFQHSDPNNPSISHLPGNWGKVVAQNPRNNSQALRLDFSLSVLYAHGMGVEGYRPSLRERMTALVRHVPPSEAPRAEQTPLTHIGDLIARDTDMYAHLGITEEDNATRTMLADRLAIHAFVQLWPDTSSMDLWGGPTTGQTVVSYIEQTRDIQSAFDETDTPQKRRLKRALDHIAHNVAAIIAQPHTTRETIGRLRQKFMSRFVYRDNHQPLLVLSEEGKKYLDMTLERQKRELETIKSEIIAA